MIRDDVRVTVDLSILVAEEERKIEIAVETPIECGQGIYSRMRSLHVGRRDYANVLVTESGPRSFLNFAERMRHSFPSYGFLGRTD